MRRSPSQIPAQRQSNHLEDLDTRSNTFGFPACFEQHTLTRTLALDDRNANCRNCEQRGLAVFGEHLHRGLQLAFVQGCEQSPRRPCVSRPPPLRRGGQREWPVERDGSGFALEGSCCIL